MLTKALAPGASAAEKLALKAAASQATRDAEAITAEYVFGYRKISNPLNMKTKLIEELSKPLQLSVNSSEQVIKDSAKLYSSHFKNDPNKLKGFLSTMKSRLTSGAARDASQGPNFWRRSILKKREMIAKIEELQMALEKGPMEEVLTKFNSPFSELLEQLPRGKAEWAAMFTIEGIPGLHTSLLRLKEISTARGALLRQLGTTTKDVSQKATEIGTGGALLREIRGNLLSRGPEGESQWALIRQDLQKNFNLQSSHSVDEIVSQASTLPNGVWKSEELRKNIDRMEFEARNYQNISEFDEWLAIKRAQKLAKEKT
jgi:hypothetical protein